jgi:hypothetical protein
MEKAKNYLKNNKLNVFVLGVFVLQVFQFVSTTVMARKNNEEISKINDDLKEVDTRFENYGDRVFNLDNTLNSRIDILDRSIKIDEKKRILVKKIREAILNNTHRSIDVRSLNRMAMSVIDYSYAYNVSVAGILAQIKVESDFNPEAESAVGAIGLGQIIPATHEYLMIRTKQPGLNPWDINDNIMMTCAYMSELRTQFGSFEDSLRAYNAGPETVKKVRAGLLKDYLPETNNYVPAVLKWNEVFKRYGLE